MKKIVLLFILIIITSCARTKNVSSEQITAYYEGFKNSDYNQIRRTLSDSLITINGDYITVFSPESYHEKFKWDSVFKPVYKLVKIEKQEKHATATVTLNSPKLEFLKNSPMTCHYKFHFKSGKIFKIVELECPDANWEIWGKEVDTLVNWVKLNHPELDGFIYDLSMKGAINYMKAIALYKNRKNAR